MYKSYPGDFDEGVPRLLQLESELGRVLTNQSVAIKAIAQSIRRELALCRDSLRPFGRFLIVDNGERTSVLATHLSRFLFGETKRIVQLDMRDYSAKHQVLGLMAINGGMVCSYFEGALTAPIRGDSRRVVVLQNIEKMHVDGWKILRDILIEGILHDILGPVCFSDTVFIVGMRIEQVEQAHMDEFRDVVQRTIPSDVLEGGFSDILWLT